MRWLEAGQWNAWNALLGHEAPASGAADADKKIDEEKTHSAREGLHWAARPRSQTNEEALLLNTTRRSPDTTMKNTGCAEVLQLEAQVTREERPFAGTL